MLVSTKTIICEAFRWVSAVPHCPYVSPGFETIPSTVRAAYTAPGTEPKKVFDGDYVVRWPHTDIVDVFSSDEFHKRFSPVKEVSPVLDSLTVKTARKIRKD
jgi:hypothetical protein